jgi:hypothetical protein
MADVIHDCRSKQCDGSACYVFKLKAELEQQKDCVGRYKISLDVGTQIVEHQRKEIETLKSELEQLNISYGEEMEKCQNERITLLETIVTDVDVIKRLKVNLESVKKDNFLLKERMGMKASFPEDAFKQKKELSE